MSILSQIKQLLGIQLFELSGASVTIEKVLVFLLFLIGTYIVSKWVRKILNSTLKKRGVERQERYPLVKLTHYMIVVLGIYLAFNSIGVPLTGLLAAAGIVGIVLGFGLQSITSNLVSGVILLGEGTLKVGDLVQVGDNFGEVTDTGVRATTVKTFDNYHLLVPNEEFFSKPFINYSYHDKKIRINVSIGVAYGTDVEKVRKILLNIADENEKVLERPEPMVFFTEHGDSSLKFELKCWISTPFNRKKTQSELNFRINKRFKEEGINIPFPQRDVWLKEKKNEQ